MYLCGTRTFGIFTCNDCEFWELIDEEGNGKVRGLCHLEEKNDK